MTVEELRVLLHPGDPDKEESDSGKYINQNITMEILIVKYDEFDDQIEAVLSHVYIQSVLKAVIFTLTIWLIFTVQYINITLELVYLPWHISSKLHSNSIWHNCVLYNLFYST